MSVIGPLAQALIERDELERRITRLERIVSALELQMTLRTNPTAFEIQEAQREAQRCLDSERRERIKDPGATVAMTVPWQAPAELERRITRLEIQLTQLHDMVRAINQRTRPPTPKSLEPDFDQEYPDMSDTQRQGYWKTEDDLK